MFITKGKMLQEIMVSLGGRIAEELILDDLFTVDESLSEEQKTGLEKYSSLIHLCMNGLGFKSLKNFPSLPKLQIVSINFNFSA